MSNYRRFVLYNSLDMVSKSLPLDRKLRDYKIKNRAFFYFCSYQLVKGGKTMKKQALLNVFLIASTSSLSCNFF